METPKAYDGKEPYIFASYSHKDKTRVWPILEQLNKDGYRVWYDSGIDPGTEFASTIAERLDDCAFFIAFVSKNYTESSFCTNELAYASKLEKDRLLVYLEDAQMPKGMQLVNVQLQNIYKNKYLNVADFYQQLYRAPGMRKCCGKGTGGGQGGPGEESGGGGSSGMNIPLKPIIAVVCAVLLMITASRILPKLLHGDSPSGDSTTIAETQTETVTNSETEPEPEPVTSSETESEPEPVQEVVAASVEAVLMSDDQNVVFSDTDGISVADHEQLKNASVFGSEEYHRNQILSVTFLNSLEKMPEDSWSVSPNGDESVNAWVEPADSGLYHLYIAADGGMKAPDNCAQLFAGYEKVNKINFNNSFYFEEVTDMSGMFMGCKELKEIDFTGFDTSKVTDMSALFNQCNNLDSVVGLESLDTSQVTDMSTMFQGCAFQSLDLTGFETGNVENFNWLVAECKKLQNLNVSNWNTEKANSMSCMFFDCEQLNELSISSFTTGSVTDMSFMFAACYALESLPDDLLDLSSATNTKNMFTNSSSLKNLTINSSVHLGNYMFEGCSNLERITVNGDLLSVGEDAFKGCNVEIQYPAGNETWEKNSSNFDENVSLSGVE